MPTITLDRKEFEKLVGKRLPDDKLKDRISMLGTDLEEVNSKEILVEVFPDRPDMLSEQGFARAFSSFIVHKTGLRKYKVRKSGEKVIVDASVKEVRPFTACAIVKNLKLDDNRIKQLMQLQEKLHITFGRNRKKAAIGIYPLERIKMPITFKAMKPEDVKFKPLEYPKELNGLEVLQLHPKGKEFGKLLSGCKQFPFFVDAAGKILSMPPIINSDDVGKVETSTREVFIECSGFDFNTLKQCLHIIVAALADMGGDVYSMEILDGKNKEVTPHLEPAKLKMDLGYVNKILGLHLKESEMKKLLERMGFGYQNKHALIPAYRADVLHPVDVVEDVAIAYGYEHFQEEIPKISTIASEDAGIKMREKIAALLTGFGLLEISSYHLTNATEHRNASLQQEIIELANALNQDYHALRASLIPSLLKVFSENKHHEYPQKIFEIATCFEKGDSETGIVEKKKLCVGVTSANAGFTDVKQILDSVMMLMGMKYTLAEEEAASFIPGRCGKILVDGKTIGHLGEVHPQVLANFSLDYPVAMIEIDVDWLVKGLEGK